MKKYVFCLLASFFVLTSFWAKEVKPLYKLPDQQKAQAEVSAGGETKFLLVGTSKGLFKVSSGNNAVPVWAEGSVEQILRTEIIGENGKVIENWYFRTSKGIIFSSDLEIFEPRNSGLPVSTVKNYDGQNTEFETQIKTLKDLCANPMNPLQMVTATKDSVFLSRDGGRNWKNIGSTSANTPGVKACAVASMPITLSDGTRGTELVVFMSHPIFGFSYYRADVNKPVWCDTSKGLELMPTLTSGADEIADIYPVLVKDEYGTSYCDLYISQTFIPRIYKYDWANRQGELIYKGELPVETYDGLTTMDNTLIYTKNEGIGALNLEDYSCPGSPEKLSDWKNAFATCPGNVNTAWIPASRTGFKKGLCLNELWLLYPGTVNSPYGKTASGQKSVYVSAYQCRLQSGIDKFKKIIKDNKLNSLVIDMKDDYGLLRYDTKDPLLLQKGKVTQYAVNLDHFVEEFKKENVYLVARIVVFKDRNLAKYGNSKYAVWNYNTKSPWIGIKDYEDVVDEETGEVTGKNPVFYDENWVDPYCPEVWEYNVTIAKELIARGFDEIQFDYIRFPTDGYNLRQASYRWKSEGMDKESALVSFLKYARENIKAPIGIDIYGANGWYRSGTRTGQDVEMMAPYVDVIGPMFYPSHFENGFMRYEPEADRVYRIYYYGTYRNTVLARNRVVVRPWVQAFYLNVSYDRQYYNKDYVLKEIFGVRDSVDRGYMYWNNAGNYEMLSPDCGPDDPFIGTCFESDTKFRHPAMGTQEAPEYVNPGISRMDKVYNRWEKRNTPLDPVNVPLLQMNVIKAR